MTALAQFEGNILIWIQQNLRTPFLDVVAKLLGYLGEAGALWIALTLVLIAVKKTRRIGIYSGISILLTFIAVNLIIKPIVGRTRPYDLFEALRPLGVVHHDGSFPSGHTANGFACAWVLFRKMDKRIGVPALILAVLMGFARCYSGVHFPTDVLTGALIGVVVAEISMRAFKKPIKKLFKRYPRLRGKK